MIVEGAASLGRIPRWAPLFWRVFAQVVAATAGMIDAAIIQASREPEMLPVPYFQEQAAAGR